MDPLSLRSKMVSRMAERRPSKRSVMIGDALNSGTGAVLAGLYFFVLSFSGSLIAETGTMFGFYFATIFGFYFAAHAHFAGFLGLF